MDSSGAVWLLITLGIIVLLASASATPSSTEPSYFDRLAAEGKVAVGMTAAQVVRAWGQPSHYAERLGPNGKEWTYWWPSGCYVVIRGPYVREVACPPPSSY